MSTAALAPKGRPKWWRPEEVLERLEAGERPMTLCKQASYEAAGDVSVRQVYNDLTVWRHTVEGFNDRYRAAVVAHPGNHGAGGGSHAPPSWENYWLAAWLATGKPIEACDMVEAEIGWRPSYNTIRNKVNRGHHLYDPDFHDAYLEVEAEILGRREDDLFDAAADPAMGPRDRVWTQIQILERRDPRYGKQTKVEHSGAVEHRHGPTKDVMKLFNQLSENRFERTAFRPEAAQIEGDVEDAEIVEEE